MAMVVKVWVRLLNQESPPSRRSNASHKLKMRYVSHKVLAVCRMRGWIRSTVGPGTSARSREVPPMPMNGRIATENMMIPMPPIHWINARQKRIPRGMLSIPWGRWGWRVASPRMVAPVVVSPDMASKKASVKEVMAPDK